MRGSFGKRTEELEERIGHGRLVGAVTFDGPAAVPQHEHPSRFSPPSWDDHPLLDYTRAGTGTRYLEGPLFANYMQYLQRIADNLYEPDGANRAMEQAAKDLKTAARRRVPRDTGDLRDTATAIVEDDGRRTYRRRGQ